MPQTPNRLQPDTPLAENIALLNDNADKAVQDISDLGAKFAGGTVGGGGSAGFTVTIPASSSLYPYTISVLDGTARYVAGRLQVVPRFDIFVDNDLNFNYLLGFTNLQNNKTIVSIYTQRTPVSGDVADYAISIQNMDTVQHVYYVYTDLSYQDSPHTGTFR